MIYTATAYPSNKDYDT